MITYRIEMRVGQDMRHVEADQMLEREGWFIFLRKSPQGGSAAEYWRVQSADVISMETKK